MAFLSQRPMLSPRPVALVGFMGCGKSTVGKALAQVLASPFVDLDHEVSLMAGQPIPEIFSVLGEAGFRDYEENAARMLPPSCVVATGGGAFAQPKTHALLYAQTLTVWLKLSPPLLWERLGQEREHRPLLHAENWQEQADTLYAARQPWYAKAHVILSADHKTVHALVHDILTCPALALKP